MKTRSLRCFCLFFLVFLAGWLLVSESGAQRVAVIPLLEEKLSTPGFTTNRFGMTFIYMPPGAFNMGSPDDETGRDSDETQHQVTLTKGFYIQTTEMTEMQWDTVTLPPGSLIPFSKYPKTDVSWNEVQTFITLLNTEGEGTYRLPTEAEWEYACRAGTATALFLGDLVNTGCEMDAGLSVAGWYCGNSGGVVHVVGQLIHNAWGLFDMHGNVWEWVQDRYDTYPSWPVIDPTGPTTGLNRVIRSGTFNIDARYCRSANRSWLSPTFSGGNTGFRLVKTVP